MTVVESDHFSDKEPQPSTSKSSLVRDTTLISKTKHVSVRAQSEILMQSAETTGSTTKGLSKSQVHRTGTKVIRETAGEARQVLREKKGLDKILHYDGKIVKEFTDGKTLEQDRLAVSISCEGENSLLCIPPCLNGTGECQSEKIIEQLESYDFKEDVVGLVFDTTASNTGREKGVNTKLNEYCGKNILHLACRHHVYECHIKNVSKIFRATCGPDHPLFKKLKEQFNDIDIDSSMLSKHEYGKDELLDKAADKSLTVISKLLEEQKLPRGDYIELAKLIRFYLSPEESDLVIKQPGAVHHARFMGQSIYYMKLKIMEKLTGIQSTAKLKQEVDSMAEFVAMYYGKWFLTSTEGVTVAPRKDLEAMWEMKEYENHRPRMADKCITSMQNHLWYLHPSIIVFALLDDGIHDEEKTEIANELHQILTEEPEKQDFSYERSKKLALEVLAEEKRPSLSKFVGAASRTVFNILKLNKEQKEFLLLPPSTWHLLTAFKKLQGFACSLPITNDAAERNVKMIQDFINSSHDESLRQDLLLAVETKRKSDAVTKASKKKKI